MEVILISGDADLYKMCREILTEFTGLECNLIQTAPESCPPGADFYIWDSPGRIDPVGLGPRLSRHLFLVPRYDVAKFQEDLGNAEAAILLKPVTRAWLTAFLGFAAEAFHQRMSSADTLRADRDEMLQCLVQANLQLQEYDQDRTNFLARAVHDFRAPLTATNGYCGLLLSEALGPLSHDQQEVLRRMGESTKRLSWMTSAMFDLSIGRHVKKKPDLCRSEIRECVEQAVHEVMPFLDNKKIALSVDLDYTFGALYMDPRQIQRVLINLLDNACRFTPKKGSIEVRGYPFFWDRRGMRSSPAAELERRTRRSTEPNAYRVDIRGSGPLIPRELLDKIFEEYTSYGGGQDRSGGGLGLAICRMILSTHDGRVWAENTEDGPCFSFVLPIRHAEPQASEITQQSIIHSKIT